jgi:hydrogenase maturation protease
MNTSTGRSDARISIVGLGNVLLGDDGFGPLAVEMFRCAYECGSNVEILDLGTPGLDLAPYLCDRDLVVIADTVHAEEKPGTLCIYCEADLFTRRGQLRLTAHDPGVQESLAQLKLAGHAPSELIIVGVVPESCGLGRGLSPSVLSTSWVAVDSIARLLVERAIDCCRRDVPTQPNFWWLSGDRPEFVAIR